MARATGGRGAGAIGVALLVTIAAPAAGYFAVREAAMATAAGTTGNPSETLPPRSIRPELRGVMRTAQHPEEALPGGALGVARRALEHAPLAYEPFFIAARVAERAGRLDRATLLMEEARRRRPNAPSVRVALLGYYSVANAYQKAIDEADMAMRVNGRSANLILPAFVKVAEADTEGRSAIAAALAKRPPWGDTFLQTAIGAQMTLPTARAMVAQVRGALGGKAPPEEAFLVQLVANSGDYRGARALIDRFGIGPRTSGAIVDAKFAGLTPIAPFGWTPHSNAHGSAELNKAAGGGLDVSFFGDVETNLVEQTLAAGPGRYVMASRASGNASAADVGVAWRLTCLPSKQLVARLPLVPLSDRTVRYETAVTLPASGCSGQFLALIGQPGEVSRTLNARVADVTLTPSGQGAR